VAIIGRSGVARRRLPDARSEIKRTPAKIVWGHEASVGYSRKIIARGCQRNERRDWPALFRPHRHPGHSGLLGKMLFKATKKETTDALSGGEAVRLISRS